ncbi:hypothetical protein NUW54_g1661 [Trametes sanguinea]|uniref:Uncharacterized protein n=2 Tax=Trametes sanguinea TaxID=158606 RepID=A0ACC1Q597_9APHY|nr:hypothetical protein NUW54_g1820 [Trametes sanguinea]KAJ3013187.1 hypothetical protein NUW54_g1661 [Trametes sanguinea]
MDCFNRLGAYTVVFVLTIWVLLYKRNAAKAPMTDPMLWISVIMFVMATMHIGINYARIIKAFVTFRDAPGGPAAFFNQLSEFTQVFGSTVYVMQTIIGDTVVLYRCYMVWTDVRVVLLPFFLLFGSTERRRTLAASGIGILYSFERVVPEAEIFVDELQSWIVSFFSLTLATNIICTGLVALRIWRLNRAIMKFARRSYGPVLFLVLESGAVYSFTLTALLILYKTGSWFQYVLLDSVSNLHAAPLTQNLTPDTLYYGIQISPIVGLVFSMIIIRIGLGITTVRGSSAVTGAPERTTTTARHSIQFAHPSDQSSTLRAAECDLNDIELQSLSNAESIKDRVNVYKENTHLAVPAESLWQP